MSPRHRYESAAPFKSSNKNATATFEKNKNIINFTNTIEPKEKKSYDPNFKKASNFENDNTDEDNSSQYFRNEENLNNEALAKESEENLNNQALAKESEENLNNKATCAECQRTFNSVKAMHGHLRSHPERSYKGAFPPPDKAKKELVLPSSQIFILNRPVTTKRDRLTDSTAEITNGACLLLYLSIKTSNQTATSYEKEIYIPPTKRKMKNMPDDFKVIKEKKDIGDEYLRNEEVYEGEDHSTEGVDNKEYIEKSHLQLLSSLIKKKKMKTKKSAGSYPCGVCDKNFSTHQALGGHMANHNKNKNITDQAFTANEANEVELSHVQKSTIEMALKGSGSRVHKCENCGQIFTSGQALGGHKRKHFLEEQSHKEMNAVLDHIQKESNVAPDHDQKKSLPNLSQKESNAAFDQDWKESSTAPDHDQKKSLSDYSHVLDDRWKENNVAPDHFRKESNVMRYIDLNKSACLDEDLLSWSESIEEF